MPTESARRAVVDASVAVKWIVDEPYSRAAIALFFGDLEWVAPRLLLVETGKALHRKLSRGEITEDRATEALLEMLQASQAGTLRFADEAKVAEEALRLAIDARHKVPDCVYLALAVRGGHALATADARLAKIARARGVAVPGIGAAESLQGAT